MRPSLTGPAAILALAGSVMLMSIPANAECKRLGFSVNDYGKDGPTKDAKELLDKHIAKTMAERGVKTYTTGKKDVKCELFLNFIVFDEHTCTAEATVCWDGTPLPKGQQVDAKAGDAIKPATSKTATGSIEKAAEKKSEPAAEKKPDTAAAVAATPAPAQASSPQVEPIKAAEKPATEPAPEAPKPAAP